MSVIVFLGRDKFELEQSSMTGAELRRRLAVPADELLYHAQGTKPVGDAITEAEMVELKNGEHFVSVPRDITGGGFVTDVALPPRVQDEIERIAAEYTEHGEVEVRADGGLGALIVRVPAEPWTPDPLTVLVRIPALYPAERPDLLFLEADARPPGGRSIPRLMVSGVSVAGGLWHQISWHFTGAYEPTRLNLLGFVRSARHYLGRENP